MTFAIQTLFFTYLNKISENQFAVASEWVFSALLLTCSMAVGQLSLPVSLWSHCMFAWDAGLYIYTYKHSNNLRERESERERASERERERETEGMLMTRRLHLHV